MKITIVTGAFLPLPPAACGAIEIRWLGVAEELAARGHEVTFISRRWRETKSRENINGVKHIRRGGFHRTNILPVDLVKSLLYALQLFWLIPRGDICINNTTWLPILLRRFRPSVGKLIFNVARYPKGQMGIYRTLSRLICPSHAVSDALTLQTPSLAAITRVVPNPINTACFVPPARPRSMSGKRYMVFTGRVHPEKGLHVLLDAFRALRDRPGGLALRIVGPTEPCRGGGGANYLRVLHEKARGLPVEFVPAVFDRSTLAKLLQEAHYYCYPSIAERGESFGVAPLEAMATGLAPIVSDLACFRDFIEDGRSGLVFDHRTHPVENLARAMSTLITDSDLALRMGAYAARIASEYSYPAITDLLLADFQGMLGNVEEPVLGGVA